MDKNLQKFEAFVTIVETGSFTAAAQKLKYSQSGISRMIGDLEREWHVCLLERNKNGIILTSEGLALLPYAKSLCGAYRQLQLEVDELTGLFTGILRLGTISSIASHWLPQVIQYFRDRYPGIKYELLLGDYQELEAWLQEGRIDLAFMRKLANRDWDWYPLAQDELLVVLPENHPLAVRNAISLETLCQEPFLLLEKEQQSMIRCILEQEKLPLQVTFTTWNDYAIMAMVECGLGISILPKLILQRVNYKIVAKSLATPQYRELGVALKAQGHRPLAVTRFLEALKCFSFEGGQAVRKQKI